MADDIFTDPNDLDRLNAERHWETYKEIKDDIERTLSPKTVGCNFTAMGVQIVSRPRDLRLIVNFTPNYFRAPSWVGKISLTDESCDACVVQVVNVPHRILKCNYTVSEVRSKSEPIEPHMLIGVFSNAQLLIEDFWNAQRALHNDELLEHGDEEDWEDYLSLPNGNALSILEPDPESWERYSSLMASRDRLAASMRELLDFNSSYHSASLENLA